jgi:hypothetical protein
MAEIWLRSKLTAVKMEVFKKKVRKTGRGKIINDNDATIREDVNPRWKPRSI